MLRAIFVTGEMRIGRMDQIVLHAGAADRSSCFLPVELSLCGQGVSSRLARTSDQQVQSAPGQRTLFTPWALCECDLPTSDAHKWPACYVPSPAHSKAFPISRATDSPVPELAMFLHPEAPFETLPFIDSRIKP